MNIRLFIIVQYTKKSVSQVKNLSVTAGKRTNSIEFFFCRTDELQATVKQ